MHADSNNELARTQAQLSRERRRGKELEKALRELMGAALAVDEEADGMMTEADGKGDTIGDLYVRLRKQISKAKRVLD